MAIDKVGLDGLDVFVAKPDGEGPFPAIILFTEALGLNSDMLENSIGKLAEYGFMGVAPDIFHGDVFDGSDREVMLAKIRSIDDDQVMAEARQTIAYLRTRPDVRADRLGSIGFCMGGRLAFLAHAELAEDMKASVAFYGGGIAPDQDGLGRKPLLNRIPEMQGALFLGYGAEDAGITPEEHGRIVTSLSGAKKRFEFQLFTDAGHAFMSVSRPNYRPEATAKAWPITAQFYERHLLAS